MGLHKFLQVPFLDANGQLRIFRGCPESRISDLARVLGWIDEHIQAHGDDRLFSEFYREDEGFKGLCDRALELCNLSPDWLTIHMIAEFILPSDEQTPSLISRVCFPINPQRARAALEQTTWEQRQAQAISNLIAVGLAQNFDEAWAIADRLTSEELDLLIQTRADSIDPKGAEKRENAKFAEELAKDPKSLLDFSGMPLMGGIKK